MFDHADECAGVGGADDRPTRARPRDGGVGVSSSTAVAEALHQAEGFESFFEHGPIGMAIVDLDRRWCRVNPALCEMLGYTEDEFREMRVETIVHPDDLDRCLDKTRRLVAGEFRTCEIEKRLFRADGDVLWTLATMSVVRAAGGEPQYFITHLQDITERKQAEAQLRRRADRDKLTGLLNRSRLEDELERVVAQAERYQRPAAVLLLDLDNFKLVNDTLGHQAGDDVLRNVARALEQRLRKTDLLARIGGDELAVVIREADEARAQLVAEALLAAVRHQAFRESDRRRMTASIGIATVNGDGARTVDALLDQADRAMYSAKREGGDRFAFSR